MERAALSVLWILMALALTVAATLICTVKVLTPERLTPILRTIAQNNLNAEVYIGRASLAFRPAFPILEIRVDSLCILSHALDSLPASQRAALPSYADSLLSIGHMRAGIDIGALAGRGEIALHDMEIVRPGINVVFAQDGTGNFNIYENAPDTAEIESTTPLPSFSVRRLAILEPRAIRYYDASDSTTATMLLLRHAGIDGTGAPAYSMSVEGSVESPIIRQFLQSDNLRIALDGCLRWDPHNPQILAIEQLRADAAFLEAVMDANVRMGESLQLDTASISIAPVRADSLLRLLPDSLRRQYRLTGNNFATDAAIALSAHLTQPFVPARDTLPHAEATVEIANSTIHYGPMRLHDVMLRLTTTLAGTDYDAAVIRLECLRASGPATSIDISGTFAHIMSDPTFDCRLNGDIRLANFPPPLKARLGGYLDGRLKTNISAAGSVSMFQIGQLHNLDIRGNAEASGLYYLKADSSSFVSAGRAQFLFGSQFAAHDTSARAPTLAAMLRVDTARALIGDVRLKIGALRIGIGVENAGRGDDSLALIPMGGAIRIGSLNIGSLNDSAGMRLRGLYGHIGLKRHLDDRRIPEISLNAGIDRLIAGSPEALVLLRNANIKGRTYIRPERVRQRREFKHIVDSLTVTYPHLQPDSVLALAIAHRRRHHRPHRRARGVMQNDTEVLDFDLSKGLRRYLSDWYLAGELNTDRAMLRTPYFPIRNRLEHIRLTFGTDSVVIDSVRYIGGNSDLAINGTVSNLRRALTGRGRSPLRINMDINSDTIDINQFAAAAFSGAAYGERLYRGQTQGLDFANADFQDDAAQSPMDTVSMSALLVPSNIEANITVAARNILYSDLLLNDFRGSLMVYDGAVNLNRLHAVSDMGNVELSALYAAPRRNDIRFGIGLQLEGFNIERFLKLVPAVDSIMPLMRDFAGTINADIAATVDIDSLMNMKLPTLDAAVRLSGEDLAFIDPETYRTMGKWLRFRDRADNRIKSMSVQLLVRNNRMQIYPFKFDIDRYTLGVVGHNDLAMNFDYHIAVLKSPLPFKFGINVKGNPDKFKVRLGGARFRPEAVAEDINMVDTVRINLVRQIQNVFRRGVRNSRFAHLDASAFGSSPAVLAAPDSLSQADSLILVNYGTAPADTLPPSPVPVSTKQ